MRNFEVSPTIEEDLNQHFSCYGDVKNVFLDKEEVREKFISVQLFCCSKSSPGSL